MRSFTLFVFGLAFASALHAQTPAPSSPDSIVVLDPLDISIERADLSRLTALQRLTLPATAIVTAVRVRETINLLDTEDAVKYLPSVFLRKRNNGDTQAVLGTRVWGTSSSARSLVFADGVPLSALIANNNTIGGPRWGLVAPAEIERIDMMWGPFSAAYAGNSMGAVMEITTRLPEKLEGSLHQTQALQTFDLYGTSDTYSTAQTGATLGARVGRFSFWASGNHQNSYSQPLGYVTSGTFPSGTTGGFAAQNKLGGPANVLGATGLLHTRMTSVTLKTTFDITPLVRASYRAGFWKNDADAGVQPYTMREGEPTYAGLSGFASGSYALAQQHSSQSLSIRSDTRSDWDFEAAATLFRFDRDRQRTPVSASSTGATFGSAGRIAVLDSTGWSTFDVKGSWHRGGALATHSVSFGIHEDRYRLNNPTFTTPDWTTGDSISGVATEGDGKTRTRALWVQDSWRILPRLKLTVGGRYELWRAYDGSNVNGGTRIDQPAVSLSRFSPKGVLSWTASSDWTITASLGKAYRFPTASELYQLVSTGTTFTSPSPDLKPDNVLASEVRIEGRIGNVRTQLSLFQDDVHDAIISQFLPLVPGSPTLYSYVSNVGHVRARGVELVVGSNDLFLSGLALSGSVTYLDAKTLALSGAASAGAAPGAAVGKQLPNIPDWRANFVGTYRPTDRLALTLAGRYSGTIYSTLDNADVNPNTYQGFSDWLVADTHASYRLGEHWSVSGGIDNLFNRKYFLFHPFPQRTFVADLRFEL
jgi:iron complex outermembrane receptor protein